MKKISNLAKKIDGVASFFKRVLIVAEVVVILVFILMLGFDDSFYTSGFFSTSLAFVEFEFIEACMPDIETMKIYFVGMMLMGIAALVLTHYEIVIIRRIIKPMIEEHPFDASVALNIRRFAWVVLIGDGIFSGLYLVLNIFEYHAFDYENLFLSDKIVNVSADYQFSLTFVWIFLIVYLLSYVFQYGQELQIQSDETL